VERTPQGFNPENRKNDHPADVRQRVSSAWAWGYRGSRQNKCGLITHRIAMPFYYPENPVNSANSG